MKKRTIAIYLKEMKGCFKKGFLYALVSFIILFFLTMPYRFDSMSISEKYSFAQNHMGLPLNPEVAYYLDFYGDDMNGTFHDFGFYISIISIDYYLGINNFQHSKYGEQFIGGGSIIFVEDFMNYDYIAEVFEKRKKTIVSANIRISLIIFFIAFIPVIFKLIRDTIKHVLNIGLDKSKNINNWIEENAK